MSLPAVRAVDPGQLRALLRAYFRLSVRETVLMRKRSGPTSFTYVLIMYGVFGLLVGLAAFAHPDVLLFSIGLHAMTLFAVGMAAIIEANEVLFDRREEEILFPLPVHASTLLLAKMGTLVGFTFLLAFALNLFPSFFGLAAADARWWFPIVHLGSVLLITVLACASVVCVYGLVLRLFGRERFENLAVWAQVGMIVMVVGGFQILPRMMEREDAPSLDRITSWLLPTPPGWFGALDAWLAGAAGGAQVIAFALTAVGVTALVGWIGVVRLASGYAETPTRVSGVPKAPREAKAIAARPWRSRNPLLRWWLRDPIEWGAFKLTTAYLRRDREIKLRVYTSLSMFGVLAVLSIVDSRSQRAGFVPLLLLAFSGTAVLTAIEALESSSQYAAAELFASTPIESAAPLYHGVRKACMLYVQAPLLAVSLLLIVLVPSRGPLTIELAWPIVVLLPLISLIPGSIGSYVPLSRPPRRGEQSARRVILILGTMLGSMGMLGVGYLASLAGLLWALVLVEIVVAVLLHAWLLRLIRARPLRRTAGD